MEIKKFKVAIIGGGPSGLSCGIMLGSSANFYPELSELNAIILDSGLSDCKRAVFFNAPGIKANTSGIELLEETKQQALSFKNISYLDSKLMEIEKEDSHFILNYFNQESKEKEILQAEIIVLATGFRSFSIEGLDLNIKHFEKSNNPSRVQVEHNNYEVAENIYTCGLFSGDSSQWPIVCGSGAQVGINIISKMMGSWKVMHDK